MVITQGGFDTRGDRNLTLQNLSDQHPISPFRKTAKSFIKIIGIENISPIKETLIVKRILLVSTKGNVYKEYGGYGY